MFESNRRLAAGLVVGVAAGLAAGGVTVATGDREDQGNFTARAKVMGAPGSGISGEVRFVQRSVGGQPEPLVDVFARVEGLPPGSKRGFHVHENGTCADAGTTQFGGARRSLRPRTPGSVDARRQQPPLPHGGPAEPGGRPQGRRRAPHAHQPIRPPAEPPHLDRRPDGRCEQRHPGRRGDRPRHGGRGGRGEHPRRSRSFPIRRWKPRGLRDTRVRRWPGARRRPPGPGRRVGRHAGASGRSDDLDPRRESRR
jgi:hypothetical protein